MCLYIYRYIYVYICMYAYILYINIQLYAHFSPINVLNLRRLFPKCVAECRSTNPMYTHMHTCMHVFARVRVDLYAYTHEHDPHASHCSSCKQSKSVFMYIGFFGYDFFSWLIGHDFWVSFDLFSFIDCDMKMSLGTIMTYGVATISRLLKIIDLCCKRAL